MKNYIFSVLAVTTLLTAAQPILAQDSSTSMKLDSMNPQETSDLNLHINPQLGMGSFEQTGKSGSNRGSSFGATVEMGHEMRKLETGLLVVNMGSNVANSTYLAIPMMAKIRILNMRAQSWYGKFGFLPAFQLSSSNKTATNNIDMLLSAGVGGRLVLSKSMDFIIEGTFNRGLMDNLKGSGDNRNQGFLILGGVSLAI